MEEVAHQLKPFKEALDSNTRTTESISRWKSSLFANGSGGPKGWLELLAEKMEMQFAELFSEVRKLREESLVQDTENQTEEKLLARRNSAEKSKRERVQMWWQIIGGIVAILVFLSGLVFGIYGLWQGSHAKAGEIKIPGISRSINSKPVVSSSQKPQESANPNQSY